MVVPRICRTVHVKEFFEEEGYKWSRFIDWEKFTQLSSEKIFVIDQDEFLAKQKTVDEAYHVVWRRTSSADFSTYWEEYTGDDCTKVKHALQENSQKCSNFSVQEM